MNRFLKLLVVLAFAAYPNATFANLPLLGAGGPGIPVGGCAQATTYLARTTSGTEGGNAANITTLICSLVSNGVITGNLSTTGCGTGSFDALYILAQQTSTDALLNLCGTNFTATNTGGATFNTLIGYNNFQTAVGRYISTNFNSTTATSPNYTQSAASFGFWSFATVAESASQMGTSNTGITGESNIYDDLTGDFYARVNQGTSTTFAPTPGTKGLFVAERPTSGGSTGVTPYWDGVAQTVQTATSQAPENAPFLVGNANSATTIGSSQTISEAHVGGALGPTLELAFFNALNTYMIAVGVSTGAPTNTVLPVITGTPQVGDTLTASNGTWTGSPTSFADQWLLGGSPISGATGSTFVPVTGDVGDMISATITATNGSGSTPATSATVGPVTSGSLVSCTGGTQTTVSGNIIATFDAAGTLTCTGSFSAQILVVGGGGGGSSAGGGGGGYCTTEGTPTCGLGSSVTIPSGATTVTVGSNGGGAPPGASTGGNGTNSVLGSIVTALGGGGGGAINANNTAGGGSGGGAGSEGSSGTLTGGVGTQGNNGGNSVFFATPFAAAGGGGAGAVGTSDTSATVAGNGGAGMSNSITGTATFYAGGGGGGFFTAGGVTAGTGGAGGGAAGSTTGVGNLGAVNTGGGGGGSGGSPQPGGQGGSGVVIISCPTSVCSAL